MTDGVILSVALNGGDPPFGYWTAMLPDRVPRTALLLGLGAGTLAHLLVRRFPQVQITGIDNNPELLAFARRHFDLDLPNLTVLIDDAFAYVATCREQFDYVAIDLFRGHEFQRKALSRPFLRQVKALTTPEGEVAVNLFRDGRSRAHVARLARLLHIVKVERLIYNVIVHCEADG